MNLEVATESRLLGFFLGYDALYACLGILAFPDPLAAAVSLGVHLFVLTLTGTILYDRR